MLKLFKKLRRKSIDIHRDAKIGRNTKIHNFCFIEGDVEIGDNCVIKPFVFICAGTRIGNSVFIGPATTFCNDRYPIANNPSFKKEGPIVGDEVSIGANCTILPGVKIGGGSLIGAGAIVTKDVPPGSIYICSPKITIKRNHRNI